MNRKNIRSAIIFSICPYQSGFVRMFGRFPLCILLSISLSIPASMYVSICVCASATYSASECTLVYLSTCVRFSINPTVYVCYVCVCIYLYICVSVYLCVCVSIFVCTWIIGALAQEPKHSTSLNVNMPSAVVSPS